MKALVSIIIPVYNVEKYIYRCVDSVLAQTYDNLEIILVDDGSTDRCPDICDEYAKRDDRIAVIHKQNGGLGYARNSGFEKSSGEFIMFVDSDDYLSEDAVEVLYDRITAGGSDLAVGKHTDIYEDGSTNSTYCSRMTDEVYSAREALSKMGDDNYIPVAAWGKLYRRKILSGISYPSLKCGEDLWVYPYIIEKCNSVSVVNKTGYYYFQRANSIMHKKSERAKYDELDAILHITRYFYDSGYVSSSQKFYAKAISRSLLFKKRRDAVNLFNKHFQVHERKQLLKQQSAKTHIKWMTLLVPVFFAVVRCIKKTA